MATISGATLSSGQGIDVATVVSSYIEAARAPERQWQTEQQNLLLQANVLNILNQGLSSLSSDIDALKDPAGALASRTVNSSQPGIVSGTATAASALGTHYITVTSLAATASYYSGPVGDANTVLGSGSFDLQVGSSQATTITVGPSDTLTSLAAAINQRSLGVSASVITDASGARLALVSNSSGSAGDITISAENGLNALPFTKGTTGSDAAVTVDGVPVSSATNTIAGVVNGLTLNLNGTSAGAEVQISIAADNSKAAQAINSFVNDYNSVVSTISGQFTYDSASGSSGPLAGDGTARIVQEQLLNAMSFALGSGATINSLSDLGITMGNDGTLSVDSAALSSALQNNFTGVQTFFQGQGSDNGFAQTLGDQLSGLTDPTEGAFNVELKGNSQSQQDLQNQIDNFEVYIGNQQSQLTNQYNLINVMLEQLPAQQQQLQALLGQYNGGSSSK